MANYYNETNKEMLFQNATVFRGCLCVTKNQKEIEEVQEHYLEEKDIKAVMLLLNIDGKAKELLDGYEEFRDIMSIDGDEWEVEIFADGYCSVIDKKTREFYYAMDKEEAPHKVYYIEEGDGEYVVHDHNMFCAAMNEIALMVMNGGE